MSKTMAHHGHSGGSSSGNTSSSTSIQPTSNNMYRVGDYVFFENSSSSSYAITRVSRAWSQAGTDLCMVDAVCGAVQWWCMLMDGDGCGWARMADDV